MKPLRSLAALLFCLALSCGGSSSNGDGGGGGSGGAAGRGGGGGGGGAGQGGGAGGRGGTTGTAGTTGGGGTGGAASCQACVSCVQANCATQIMQCQANTDCNAIYECVRQCTMDVNSCVSMHLAGVIAWGPTVAQCFNQNCAQTCQF